MILVRSLSCIWPVVFVATMVCLHEKYIFHEADEAVAHRQCARNAEALKNDEGKVPVSSMEYNLLKILFRRRKLVLP